MAPILAYAHKGYIKVRSLMLSDVLYWLIALIGILLMDAAIQWMINGAANGQRTGIALFGAPAYIQVGLRSCGNSKVTI